MMRAFAGGIAMHVRFTIAQLTLALNVVLPFASKDIMCPRLNCIRVELLTDGRVAFVAADGHRVAIYSVTPADVLSAKKRTAVSYDLRQIASLMGMLKPHTKSPADLEVDIKTVAGVATLHRAGHDVAQCALFAGDEGHAPYRDALRAKPGDACHCEIDAEYAAAAFAAFSRATTVRPVGVTVHTDGELGPIVFLSSHVPALTIVTMPRRKSADVVWPKVAGVAVQAKAVA